MRCRRYRSVVFIACFLLVRMERDNSEVLYVIRTVAGEGVCVDDVAELGTEREEIEVMTWSFLACLVVGGRLVFTR